MAENNFVEFLSDKALSDLKIAAALLKEQEAQIKSINALLKQQGQIKPLGSTPSQSAGNASVSSANIVKVNSLMNQQVQITKKLTEARAKLNPKTAEESVNLRLLAANASRAAQANSTFANSYERLSAQQNIAARAVQNLIARGRTATQTQREYDKELKTAQKEFDVLNKRVLLADSAVGRFNRNVGNYPKQAAGALKDLVGAFGVVGGVTAFAAISKDIFDTTKQIQGLNFALKQVSGTTESYAETQQFLSRISEAYGIEILGLTKSYTGFLAASQNAIQSGAISAQQIQNIFESVSKASGAMGLSVEQQEGAFLALQQMISKGNVQAEEIRGQLAERLPGAFGILAKSMGVTEVELNKLLKDGKVLAADVLPAFAKELEKAYGVDNLNRVESLTAETIRLKNTWTEFIASLQDGNLTGLLTGIVKSLSESIGGLAYLFQTAEQSNKSFNKTLFDSTYAEWYASFKKSQDDATTAAIKLGDSQVEASKKGEKAAADSAKSVIEYNNEQIASNEENIRSLTESVAANQKLSDSLSFFHQKTADERKKIASIDDEKKRIEELGNINTRYQAENAAAAKFLVQDETKTIVEGNKIKIAKQADYLASKYALLKKDLEDQANIEQILMNSDEISDTRRIASKEKYYALQAELSKAALAEELRLINYNYNQQYESLREQLKKEQITRANYQAVLDSMSKQRVYDRLLAEENNAEAVREIYRGLQQDLKGITAEAELSKVTNIIDEKELKLTQSYTGELKKLIESNADYHKILELEKKLKDDLLSTSQDQLIANEQEKLSQMALFTEENKNSEAYKKLQGELIAIRQQRADLDKSSADEASEAMVKLQKATEDYLKSVGNGSLGDLGFSSLSTLFDKVEYEVTDSLGNIQKKTASTFQMLIDGATTTSQKIAIITKTTTDVLSQLADFTAQNTQAKFDAQYAALERQYSLDQEYNAKGEEAKAELQRKYDEKRRAIRLQEAKAEKENAIFKAVINIAQGVTSALATANIPLSIIIGAIGAAQIAAIASRPLPAYKMGTANHPGGDAIVGDGGSELVYQPSSGWSVTPNTPTVMSLERGSKVFPNANDYRRELPVIDYNGGVSIDYDRMGASVGKYLPPQFGANFDKRGITAWSGSANARITKHNNRIAGRKNG